MEQKSVLKLGLHKDKDKKKAMKIASGFFGVNSISCTDDGKLTVTGAFDPIKLVEKLRKFFSTEMVSVGPAKEEKKGNNENKKGDDKNTGGGKDQKTGDKVVPFPGPYYPPYPYQYYPPRPAPPMYYYDRPRSIEEDPTGCVIC